MTITVPTRMVLACCWSIFCGTGAKSDVVLDVLVRAYPEQLAAHDGQHLIWKDGTRQPISDGRPNKTFDELLNHPSIIDQFEIPYRLGAQTTLPSVNEDPGRIRNEDFFKKMYGDCRKGEVAGRLRPVRWLPHRGGGTIMATQVNGIADRLEQISAELEKLPPSITQYAVPSSGVYSCRKIAEVTSFQCTLTAPRSTLMANSAIIGSGTRRAMVRSIGATQSPIRLSISSNDLDSSGVASGIILIRFILSIGRKSSIWRGKTGPAAELAKGSPIEHLLGQKLLQYRILLLPQSG